MAKAKAHELRQRFGIKRERVPRPRRRQRRTFVADSLGGVDWRFNIHTGEHSKNVKVHHHTSRSNWKIEMDQSMGDAVTERMKRGAP